MHTGQSFVLEDLTPCQPHRPAMVGGRSPRSSLYHSTLRPVALSPPRDANMTNETIQLLACDTYTQCWCVCFSQFTASSYLSARAKDRIHVTIQCPVGTFDSKASDDTSTYTPPTGPQLPNCQTQCHFSWLVVSPLRQKSTRSGNLVLAVILAFYAIKTASLSPLGPLATSNSALRTGAAPQASSWWTWAPAAHLLPVPSSDSTQPSVF